MKHLTINHETLTTLQTFESIENMNESIKAHKEANQLSKTDRAILDAIGRYSCKHMGVSYLSKQGIAEEAGFKSRRTAIRSCKRLEALGIIKQYETRRAGGDRRRSVDIIVIKPIQSERAERVENTRVTAASHGKETPSKTIKHKTSLDTGKGRDSTPIDYIKRGLRNAIPAPIYDALSPFFNGRDMYDTYGVLLRAKARIDADKRITIEDYHSEYIDAFMNAIRLYKAGRVRNLSGYLFVAWSRLTAQISRQLGASNGSIYAYNPYK